jgi:hypothetical protein
LIRARETLILAIIATTKFGLIEFARGKYPFGYEKSVFAENANKGCQLLTKDLSITDMLLLSSQ